MNTKARIIVSADSLFYHQGFAHTSFANIAKAVGISRGNFYHHFKTKDEILRGVIELRLQRAKQQLETWQRAHRAPIDRVKDYFSFLAANNENIKLYGCPLATLNAELAKHKHPLTGELLQIYRLYRHWLAVQFELLGYAYEEADILAVRVISLGQGMAASFNAFQDDALVERELTLVFKWLDDLGLNNKINSG